MVDRSVFEDREGAEVWVSDGSEVILYAAEDTALEDLESGRSATFRVGELSLSFARASREWRLAWRRYDSDEPESGSWSVDLDGSFPEEAEHTERHVFRKASGKLTVLLPTGTVKRLVENGS